MQNTTYNNAIITAYVIYCNIVIEQQLKFFKKSNMYRSSRSIIRQGEQELCYNSRAVLLGLFVDEVCINEPDVGGSPHNLRIQCDTEITKVVDELFFSLFGRILTKVISQCHICGVVLAYGCVC
jgi:hypothetical protein